MLPQQEEEVGRTGGGDMIRHRDHASIHPVVMGWGKQGPQVWVEACLQDGT